MESLGIPVPGETALIVAGLYAGHTHHLSAWLICAVAAAAAITGDNVGYWIGSRGGYRLARRYGPRVRLDERKLKVARYLFDRHGGKVVFFGRFVSILRTARSTIQARRASPARIDGDRVHEARTLRSRVGTSTLTVNGINHRRRMVIRGQDFSLTRH
ncbi:MAG: DedA family protein [Streptosporangiaceae bacterium]